MTKPKKQVEAASLSLEHVSAAVAEGKTLIEQGKPKVEAAMAIYRLIGTQPQETVLQAFIEGATLTPKGALTYWYNCKRKLARETKKAD